jgi:hypothetical protein
MFARRVLIITTTSLVLTGFGLFSADCRAQVVPEASYSAGVLGTAETGEPLDAIKDDYITTIGSVSASLTLPGDTGGTASNVASTGPLLQAQVGGETSGGLGAPNASSGAAITYYYEVIGPYAASVPIRTAAFLSTSADGTSAVATALYTFASNAYSIFACSSSPLGYCNTYPSSTYYISPVFFLTAAQVYFNQLEVQGGAGTLPDVESTSGSYTAAIDPTLTIDPAWLASNPGLSIVYSSNVELAGPVPVPSTWVLLLSGFAGLGALARRKRAA